MTTYNIKTDKDRFDRWTSLAMKYGLKMSSITLFQNDGEITKKELGEWFTKSLEEIQKADKAFNEVIGEFLAIREEIIKDVREQSKG